jgi:hypothetical protein
MTSSVSSFTIEVLSIVLVSGFSSDTLAESKISADDISSPVVIPEVM